jgi:hypothetical protein
MDFQRRHDKAIVTLAVGAEFTDAFMARYRPSWEAYAARHGYDLVLLTEPIDKAADLSRKSIHWQKLLVGVLPPLRTYRHLVWVDGDVLINHRLAPCIVSALKEGGIGVVDISGPMRTVDETGNLHVRFLLLTALLGWRLKGAPERVIVTDGDVKAHYRNFGLDGAAERFINTGVMVFDPARWGDFLARCYVKYDRDFGDFENTPLSFELQVNGAAEYLDGRFNLIWAAEVARNYPFLFNPDILARNPDLFGLCVNVAFRNAFFLHFAGSGANPLIKKAAELVTDRPGGVPALVLPAEWAKAEGNLKLVPLAGLEAAVEALGPAAKDWNVRF